ITKYGLLVIAYAKNTNCQLLMNITKLIARNTKPKENPTMSGNKTKMVKVGNHIYNFLST
ncbi:TPA: hypothetical protein ACHU6Y_001993, partial [Streptococcus suis]